MEQNTRADFYLPVLGLVVAMLFWGSSFIAMKIALSNFDAPIVMLGRMSVAASIFLAFRKRFGKIEYRKGDWRLLGFMALCEPCLYFSFETQALKFTSASEASMITSLLPLMTALAAWLVLGERITKKSLIGLFIALFGVMGITLCSEPSERAPHPLLGNFLELISMVCATGYTIMSRHLAGRYSAFFLTAVQAFVGSIFFMPAALFPNMTIPAQLTWKALAPIVYLGAVVNVLAYFLYNYALSRIPASQVSPYVNLIPVFSMLIGWLILNEQLTFFQYAAASLVLGGSLAGQERRT